MQTGSTSMAGPTPASGPSSQHASFAGLLATMAAPQGRVDTWNEDGLADDVATISYERALRSHARARAADADAQFDRQPPAIPSEDLSPENSGPDGAAKPLKTASITIRLSAPECAQLRRRAAEAGMTVSAYLRSCTLEVESLRAQVKETLSELRRSAPAARDARRGDDEPAGRMQILFERIRQWFRRIGRRRRVAMQLNPSNPFAPVG